jgi:hypothetical protein
MNIGFFGGQEVLIPAAAAEKVQLSGVQLSAVPTMFWS